MTHSGSHVCDFHQAGFTGEVVKLREQIVYRQDWLSVCRKMNIISIRSRFILVLPFNHTDLFK